MRRRSSVETSRTSPSPSLNPILQAALESLDVNLENELARYRRLCDRHPGHTTQYRNRPMPNQPNLLVINAAADDLALASPGDGVQTRSTRNHRFQQEPAGAIDPEMETAKTGKMTNFSAQSDLGAVAADPFHSLTASFGDRLQTDEDLDATEDLFQSVAGEESLRAEQEPGMLESLLTPLGIGSMLLLLLSSITFGYLIMNPSSVNLFSFERFFNRPSPSTTASPSIPAPASPATEFPTTPNLAQQEFKDLNLDTLSTLPTKSTLPDATGTPTPVPTPAAAAPSSDSATTIPDPAISSESIPATLEQRTTPAPRRAAPAATPPRSATASSPPRRAATEPSTTAPTSPRSSSTRPATPPAARSTVTEPSTPTRSATPPTTTTARVEPAPIPVITPSQSSSGGDLYHVVTQYTGDRSLEQVRQVAGDAFVRNTNRGAQIQVGAFSDQQRAEELIQDLQQQGISAQIVDPDGQ